MGHGLTVYAKGHEPGCSADRWKRHSNYDLEYTHSGLGSLPTVLETREIHQVKVLVRVKRRPSIATRWGVASWVFKVRLAANKAAKPGRTK